jgi:hypothetical protein
VRHEAQRKSHLLGKLAEHFPRRLIFDFIGEHSGKIKNALEAYTFTRDGRGAPFGII